MKLSWVLGPKSNDWCPYERKERRICHTDTGQKSMRSGEGRGRGGRDTATTTELPEAGRGEEDSPPERADGACAYQHLALDLWLQKSERNFSCFKPPSRGQ